MSGELERIQATLARASREQIHIGREARELEMCLQRFVLGCGEPVGLERLLGFVAEVRLSSARTGGDLCELLLHRDTSIQMSGGVDPTIAESACERRLTEE